METIFNFQFAANNVLPKHEMIIVSEERIYDNEVPRAFTCSDISISRIDEGRINKQTAAHVNIWNNIYFSLYVNKNNKIN